MMTGTMDRGRTQACQVSQSESRDYLGSQSESCDYLVSQ